MSTFDWLIEEASNEPLPVQHGGEVDIEALSVSAITTGWDVGPPNELLALVPQASGLVEPVYGSKTGGKERLLLHLAADKTLFRTVVIAIVVLVGVIVVESVLHGRVDLQSLLISAMSFAAGKGADRVGKAKPSGTGNRSG